ncbi:hypothetical protein JCM4814A_73080 [Streptomyces phaeofaciens JCM 4814]|uniref:Uncharacterized protein n=1 Tax=Streptomyces phaeofaciens TaxID=68254 RepID=A0A918LW91_9ACTN|nr:hypothetical protein [Streptomyces phaeofaciens]GGT62604.1 hypothetical protein GCM10010226_45540 [Streptomyces phaeofaciens]
MIEIFTALIGGVFLLGGAVITARWTRSRSTTNPTPAPAPPANNTQPDGGTANTPPPHNSRSGGITVNGQFIETNNGSVSQTNYRDGKQ